MHKYTLFTDHLFKIMQNESIKIETSVKLRYYWITENEN